MPQNYVLKGFKVGDTVSLLPLSLIPFDHPPGGAGGSHKGATDLVRGGVKLLTFYWLPIYDRASGRAGVVMVADHRSGLYTVDFGPGDLSAVSVCDEWLSTFSGTPNAVSAAGGTPVSATGPVTFATVMAGARRPQRVPSVVPAKCACNLMIGCTCGVFAAEQAAKVRAGAS